MVVRAAPPAVALETAVISTGLPAEVRRTATQRMAAAVSEQGAAPAFVGVVAGQPTVGLTGDELELLGRIAEHTEGRTVHANLALLERNASVAAAIANAVHALDG